MSLNLTTMVHEPNVNPSSTRTLKIQRQIRYIHTDAISSCAISRDGCFALLGSNDGHASFLDLFRLGGYSRSPFYRGCALAVRTDPPPPRPPTQTASACSSSPTSAYTTIEGSSAGFPSDIPSTAGTQR